MQQDVACMLWKHTECSCFSRKFALFEGFCICPRLYLPVHLAMLQMHAVRPCSGFLWGACFTAAIATSVCLYHQASEAFIARLLLDSTPQVHSALVQLVQQVWVVHGHRQHLQTSPQL